MERTILHCDLNNFYASVECKTNPTLKDKFVAVCGNQSDRHGIVLAKNQLAKRAGVKTGEAIWQAQQKCPDLVIVHPNFDLYLKYSEMVRKIYLRYTDEVEPFGIDECWLDVTGSTRLFGSGFEIAEEIRESVKSEIGITISAGVSFNKIFAKLGSDMKKPDAVTCINKDSFKEQIWHLPASDLMGVGRSTGAKLKKYFIRTIGDLANADPAFLKRLLGKNGLALWLYANGMDNSEVLNNDFLTPVKSIGHGITCKADLTNNDEVWQVFLQLTQDISHKLRLGNMMSSSVQITVKDNLFNFKQYQCPLEVPTQSYMDLAKTGFFLFKKNYEWENNVRSLTLRAINLISDQMPWQMPLTDSVTNRDKREKAELAMEKIKDMFGKHAVFPAVLLNNSKLPGGMQIAKGEWFD